jgi:UPF0042 nucleotide-binding protein
LSESASKASTDRAPNIERQRVILVTGLSGAGRSSALKAFEDMGYDAIDNLPLILIRLLLAPAASGGPPTAIGIDARARDFGAETLVAEVAALKARSDMSLSVLFLDCDSEALVRRFTETRRRHPFAVDRPLADGIQHERRLLAPLRDGADWVLDTTAHSVAELRRLIRERWSLDPRDGMAVTIVSFAYRRGIPREADLVFDVRFLDNPHYDPLLRPLDGRDPKVGERVAGDPDFAGFFRDLTSLLRPLLPRYYREGKSYLTVAVGCTGGRHRSVYVAERVAEWMRSIGQRTSVEHRDVDLGRG